jgi:hypothetical protein
MQDDAGAAPPGASTELNPLMIPSGRGRRAVSPSFTILREVTREDLEVLAQARGTAQGQSVVKSLKYTHHKLARALAAGMTPGEAAQRTGYTLNRVSILQQDPAFCELISHYVEELQEIYVDVHERMAALGIATIEELQERFCEAPEKFSNKELMNLAEMMIDRSVPTAKGGPKTIPQAGQLALNIQFIESPAEGGGGGIEAQEHPALTIDIEPND